MFSKKYPVLFVSRHFVESGTLTHSRESFFEAGESLSYQDQSLISVLEGMKILQGKTYSLVLSEELVYVTALSFPRNTPLTRALIQERAQELIPEHLNETQWDFRTMQYVTAESTADTLWVQVAVVEKSFAADLEEVISSRAFSLTLILPESYALASLMVKEEGMTVIVECDRENTLFVACNHGLVLATEVKQGEFSLEALRTFLHFIEERTSQKSEHIIFSHIQDETSSEALKQEGYSVLTSDYNPLFSLLLERGSGADDQVLNLNVSRTPTSQSWFGRWRKKAS